MDDEQDNLKEPTEDDLAEKEKEEVCEFCGGTGEISADEEDGEGHSQKGVGVMPCPDCRPPEDDFEI